MGETLPKRHRAHWPVVLAVLAAYRAFRSVLRFASENISGNVFPSVVPALHFLSKSQRLVIFR